jgi:hypothetical protein
MPTAARLPSATLSMMRRGPNTQSPPAKTPLAEVISVCGFTAISPRGETSTPSSGQELQIGRLADGHDDGVAIQPRLAVLVESRTEAAVGIEDRLGLEHLKRHGPPILADDLLRTEAGMDDDALFFRLFNLFQRGRHLARFSRQTRCTSCAPSRKAESETSIISRAATASMLPCEGSKFSTPPGMLAQHFAGRGPGHIHGHVAAADDENLLADGEPVAEIHIEQKIDALVDAVQIHAGNGEVAAAVRANRNQNGIEVPPQIGDGEIAAGRLVQFQRDVAGGRISRTCASTTSRGKRYSGRPR